MAAAYNEQVKLTASFVNTTGIGIFAAGVVKPVVETGQYDLVTILEYGYSAIIIHLIALYIMSLVR